MKATYEETYKKQLKISHSLSSDKEEESECMPNCRTPQNAFPESSGKREQGTFYFIFYMLQ